jgi:hypothetical protein
VRHIGRQQAKSIDRKSAVLVRLQLLPGHRQSVGQGLFKPFAVAGRLAPAGG